MKLFNTNEFENLVTENIPLLMSSIKEVHYEDLFTKSGDNKSYFLVYIDTPLNDVDKHTWLQVTIPFTYAEHNGKVIPVYEEKITSHELHLNEDDEAVSCELTEDEKLMLINVCIRALLEDFICSELIAKKA
ncbi:MAG: hypothetical protein CVU91_10520 [Firmicutes bacterium HGW-Firmicutes-16]|nr:MAG: hypothetical protein CVU91_10520 [Firmicutes bacterium HGW-Firmicutes-16]